MFFFYKVFTLVDLALSSFLIQHVAMKESLKSTKLESLIPILLNLAISPNAKCSTLRSILIGWFPDVFKKYFSQQEPDQLPHPPPGFSTEAKEVRSISTSIHLSNFLKIKSTLKDESFSGF